jgi:hypothetical protein
MFDLGHVRLLCVWRSYINVSEFTHGAVALQGDAYRRLEKTSGLPGSTHKCASVRSLSVSSAACFPLPDLLSRLPASHVLANVWRDGGRVAHAAADTALSVLDQIAILFFFSRRVDGGQGWLTVFSPSSL